MAGSTESNSTHFIWRQLFRKYFRYARMTSLKISKFDFSATISNINAQFAPVNKGLNSASIRLNNVFESTSCMREWFHWNFQSLISTLLLTVFMRSLRQWKEDLILHVSGCNNFFRKYFRYARMTSLKFSKFNFYAATSTIYAQFFPVSRGLYSACLTYKQLSESTSVMREWRHLNFQS